LCSGHLNLDLFFDYELATAAPACAPEDERCALSVNASFGGADSTTVWAAFDAESNELRFSAGIPTFPGSVEVTDYPLDVQFGDGTTMSFGDPLPAVALPVRFSDGTNDCLDNDEQPVECVPMDDLQAVSLDPEIIDGVPFLIAVIETAADLPLDRIAETVPKLSKELKTLAIKSVQIAGLEFGGVDILVTAEENYFVVEANYPCHFERVQRITGVDIAGKMVDYLLAKNAKD